jgi:PAS domain S-box-containing protein
MKGTEHGPRLDDRDPLTVDGMGLGARDALHLIVSLGDFQSRLTRDQDAPTIIGAARLLLRRLMPFRWLAFMSVDEPTAEFVLNECDPDGHRAAVEQEIERTIADGTFAWALPKRRAVTVRGQGPGQMLVLHPLLTRSRVIGMFIGALEDTRLEINETLLSVLSVILFTTAQALENSTLYRSMKATTVSKELLEAANAELRQEIADRRRAEEALRLSEERYRDLFDNAHDLIYTLDLDGRFTSMNRAAERVFGYASGEGPGHTLFEVLTPESATEARRMLEITIGEPSRPSVHELHALSRDGERVVLEVSARAIWRHGEPIGVQGIARDLTERQRLEAQLQQSQKMEAVGRLAGGVAHDFNNMMMVVVGYADIMSRRLADGKPVGPEIDHIKKAADSAASLTRQLLAFSRRQVLQARVLDLNVVVAGIDRMLRRLIPEDIELVTLPGATLGRVEADQGQIEQVIMNLVVNARDSMPNGGCLTIETADVERRPAGAGSDPRPFVMLSVRDTGHGMDAETQSHIFEPFYTTKEKSKGTGLGLSTVYGIVEQHHGWIEVDSAVGRGTVFAIFLPSTEEPVERREATGEPLRTLGGIETILLVEDETPVRNLVRAILTEHGYTVFDAADGLEAIAQFERHGDQIHLLLTDIVMPQMSGHALATRLTAVRPELKVVYMSGYADDVMGHHGMLDAQVAYLQKPFAPDTLARKLRELLHGAVVSVP